MTSRATIFLMTVAAMLVTLVSAADESSEFITTPKGKLVPLRWFDHLSNVTKDQLYVISALQLTGTILSVDLKSTTEKREESLSGSHDPPKVSVDDKNRADVADDGYFREGDDFVIAMTDDDTVIGLWGNRLSLQPVNLLEDPTLFINIATQNDLTGDEEYEPADDMNPQPKGPIVEEGVLKIQDGDTSPNNDTTERSEDAYPWKPKKLEIAVAFDNSFCKRYGGKERFAVTAIRALLRQAGLPFGRQINIDLKVVLVQGYCNPGTDPYRKYSTIEPKEILPKFRKLWLKKRQSIRRDIALLVPGFATSDFRDGTAWMRGTCSNRFGFSWGIGSPVVIAHEIAHSLGATHASSGLMKAAWGPSTPLKFADKSVKQMNKFIKSGTSSCLGTHNGGDNISSGKTCAAGFSRNKMLSCTTKSKTISVYGSGKRKVGKTKLDLGQHHGQFHVKLTGLGQVRIRSVSVAVRYENSLTSADMPAGKEYKGRGVKKDVTKLDIGKLKRPVNSASCCGAVLFTYVLIKHCLNSKICSHVFFTGTARTECRKCSRGNSSPMSSTRRCPSCS